MNIGFVSTWFERGAAYVTKSYIDLLKDTNSIFVYARGGEGTGKGDSNWDYDYVTWAPRLYSTNIRYNHIKKWIEENGLDIIFFNEQWEVDVLHYIKRDFPLVKIGSYVDYYTEKTISDFDIYDFLICNTKRHYSVFKNHFQSYYVPWGTNIDLFQPLPIRKNKKLTFFHSAGMSNRKGTTYLIDTFLENRIYEKADLVIHIQKKFENVFNYNKKELEQHNIKIIEGNVTAPGLYYLGDVYVYPTTLDGLGLTMYEALSSGLPVITTNNAPMNEVVSNNVGKLVEVEHYYARADGYYWPLSIINKESLYKCMKYYIENINNLMKYQEEARMEAVKKWNWNDRKEIINEIFIHSEIRNSKILYNKNKMKFNERIINSIGSSKIYQIYNYFATRLKK